MFLIASCRVATFPSIEINKGQKPRQSLACKFESLFTLNSTHEVWLVLCSYFCESKPLPCNVKKSGLLCDSQRRNQICLIRYFDSSRRILK